MNFGITYNSSIGYGIPKTDGLDYSEIRAVSKELLSGSSKAGSALTKSNLDKFSVRPNIGIDLYSGNITPEVAKNISTQNSGHNITLTESGLNSIQYLNTQAAKYATNLSKVMDGKIYVAANAEIGFVQPPSPQHNTVQTVSGTAKESQGGNPFSAGAGNTNLQKH